MRVLLIAVYACLMSQVAFAQVGPDELARKEYLAKRAAERVVVELSRRDVGDLSADDSIRLALAYNELGDNKASLDAVCRVADETLAAKKQLDLKAICFHNVSGSEPAVRIRELAFIDRCLDRKYGSEAVAQSEGRLPIGRGSFHSHAR
ncbi:hypothetical protein [Anatilimnocola floriformis]|uniref:hypothetical protein n=1 Tax=Anatilimnocola floriformis TaxID=2948575 RepID=UPI0020C516A0|nr:hypothetical protein [Anatilimnocola floriformis]